MNRQRALLAAAIVGIGLGGWLVLRAFTSDRPSVQSVMVEVYENESTAELKRQRYRMATWIAENEDHPEHADIARDRKADLERIDEILRQRGVDPESIDATVMEQPVPERAGEG